MKTTNIFIAILILNLTAFNLSAQDFKIISATEQRWSGGIAGRMGTNFNFEIVLQKRNSKITPDTIWVDGKFFPLTIKDNGIDYNFNTSRTKYTDGFVHYHIVVGVDHSDYTEMNIPHPFDEVKKKEEKTLPTKHFSGVAFITYMKGKKQKGLLIKTVKYLEPLNYP